MGGVLFTISESITLFLLNFIQRLDLNAPVTSHAITIDVNM